MSHVPLRTPRSLASRLGLGRLAYLTWHAPKAAAARSWREGGPLNQWRDARGRRAMEEAAVTLPTSRAALEPGFPELHFLTGKKFWYQTVFCLHSLQLQAGGTFRAVFHDDGSFDDGTRDRLRTLFPAAELRSRADNDARTAAALPPDRFPFLHDRRRHYPNILKLTDVHAGASGWRLVLDSDMLFFRRPDFLLTWLRAPQLPLHMLDVGDAYGYPDAELTRLAGAPVPHKINVGLTGLRSDALDWDRLEYWCRELIQKIGTSYYLEQALIAMLFANQSCAIAPRPDYLLLPDVSECQAPTAVMHHYVAESKRGYFRHAWHHVVKSAA
jgi:hypothetical protein